MGKPLKEALEIILMGAASGLAVGVGLVAFVGTLWLAILAYGWVF